MIQHQLLQAKNDFLLSVAKWFDDKAVVCSVEKERATLSCSLTGFEHGFLVLMQVKRLNYVFGCDVEEKADFGKHIELVHDDCGSQI